ncbi:murein biosynthesis integral membrane protein MurJ [Dehalobacterium formicoaceticum]|uniref:Probable lipid II flippase MurJ n=1 Tax=Dehalobacterium formicoaceticum TaxID=51515 RepID=A0ABT1Y270_9FIRM|nr:murein biosynthesis integral membrane protein MurJ [Dehalobacterium formicoaceticum]MCR6544949.1 murein biosynthesis integral membrane protein MurJ [Dehalobacterium formicoaceticum]
MSQNNRVVKAAGFLMVTMVVSRILGYLRDIIIYAQYGQNRITDAYNAAFSIPDFLYMLLVGGALSSSFIPVFSGYIATQREEEGWQVASVVITLIMMLLGIGIFLGFIFTPELILLLVPGFDPAAMELTVTLTRIILLQVIFMALSGISMGILNSYKIFTPSAIGSVLYNLGIIVCGVLFGKWIESIWPGYGIAGFSIGVVLGAMANFAVQVPALLRIGFRFKPNFNIFHPGVVRLVKLMVPVLIGLSISQINLFVNQNLASSLPAGGIAALNTAQRLMQLPVGIFAIAIAVAVFPTLTEQAAKREREAFKKTFSLGLRSVIFITLPCAVGLAVLRVPIIRFMFEFDNGKFTHQDTLATAYALLYYCIGLFAYSAIHVVSRAFYALQNTMIPVFVGALAIAANITLSILLVGPMAQGGLALAYSLAGILNMLILLWMLRKKIGAMNGRQMIRSFGQTLLASSIMGIACFYTARFCVMIWGVETKLAQLLQLSLSIGVGIVVFAVFAIVFRMEESELVLGILRRKLRRKSA